MADVILALTAAGTALKAKTEAGLGDIPLTITRIMAASGQSADPLHLTALTEERQAFTVKRQESDGANTVITVELINDRAGGGYPLTQIGIFALDPDEGEILYRISQYERPLWVPSPAERRWVYEPTFTITTGNAAEVRVNADLSVKLSAGTDGHFGRQHLYRK